MASRKLSLFLAIYCMGSLGYASEDFFVISDESLKKLHADEFVKNKVHLAEAPTIFKGKKEISVPHAIAFEDYQETIHLTPGDVIKISEDLTLSDWGGSSATQVAEEDFTLPEKTTQTPVETKPNTKNIKFSRT